MKCPGRTPSLRRTPENSQAVRAELAGSDTAIAAGITVRGDAPLLMRLCRQLMAAGCHPGAPLDAYRGTTLALRIRSIGEAAGLEINGHGTGFRRVHKWGSARHARQNESKAVAPPSDARRRL